MAIVGHGIDLVEVERIRAMLDRHADRFLARVFTPGEAARGLGSRRYAEHLAGRFAAKEAVLKCLGTGLSLGISWTDVEVVVRATGQPEIVLHGPAAVRAATIGARSWHLSITHTQTHAAASVIAESGD